MFAKKIKGSIRGSIVVDKKTKNLVKRVRPGQIAVICHEDLDEIAARDLVSAKVKAVINLAPSITGSYVSVGARILLQHGVPLYDSDASHLLPTLSDGETVEIVDDSICLIQTKPITIREITMEEIGQKWEMANQNLSDRLGMFIENTLIYAQKEKSYYISPLPHISSKVNMNHRHVLIVVRGKHYREDLKAIRSYIQDYRPVLIGVDGGADALLEEGWKPDIIIGDMDSVSDAALFCGAEIIVHAYPNGHAPAKERLVALGIPFEILPAPGTSEDVAMLFADEKGAEWIVALGAHSNMIDFLEKGRRGMASTVLVRMKMGMKLIDAKGVSMLYQNQVRWKNFFFIGTAAAVPMIAASVISPAVRQFWHLLWLQIKFFMM
ncbi:putative cytokinetic ring protein SteA [Ammoniphilus resinae]|uniref:Membrane-anchored protein n=1 Tax=Ammoniphilus resinae TaxID=861532 RepID=A0ABS4GTF5_9BACL|nr:putative cytokinetic ring protein SteA [Ammoniphilus resinae]MBP1933556.1 putative membrane-anchored protein [Ammoniphilus resinae]